MSVSNSRRSPRRVVALHLRIVKRRILQRHVRAGLQEHVPLDVATSVIRSRAEMRYC